MKRNYFVTNVSSNDSLENVLKKYIDNLYDILIEDAKRCVSDRKPLEEDKDDDLDEEAKNDSNWYDICLEAAKRYRTNRKLLDEDEDDGLDDEDYDDEEARDDAAFADFDRRHVFGDNDFQSNYDYYRNGSKTFNPYEDDEPKYSDEHFGAGFEIDEPRLEDYTDRKKFEDDLAAYDRFVEAGEDCVRRGLEKPEWANSVKVDEISDDVDDEPYICKIYLRY